MLLQVMIMMNGRCAMLVAFSSYCEIGFSEQRKKTNHDPEMINPKFQRVGYQIAEVKLVSVAFQRNQLLNHKHQQEDNDDDEQELLLNDDVISSSDSRTHADTTSASNSHFRTTDK